MKKIILPVLLLAACAGRESARRTDHEPADLSSAKVP